MELLVKDYGEGFPDSSEVKNPLASAEDTGSIPDLGTKILRAHGAVKNKFLLGKSLNLQRFVMPS